MSEMSEPVDVAALEAAAREMGVKPLSGNRYLFIPPGTAEEPAIAARADFALRALANRAYSRLRAGDWPSWRSRLFGTELCRVFILPQGLRIVRWFPR